MVLRNSGAELKVNAMYGREIFSATKPYYRWHEAFNRSESNGFHRESKNDRLDNKVEELDKNE